MLDGRIARDETGQTNKSANEAQTSSRELNRKCLKEFTHLIESLPKVKVDLPVSRVI